jgi:AcrR family transcriptional regulator
VKLDNVKIQAGLVSVKIRRYADAMAGRPKAKRGTYHHGDLRRALLDGALEVIEEKGVSAVGIRDLARRLGVSHAAPAHHFHDRTALLVEVATEGFRLFADTLETAARTKTDPVERLVAIGCAYVRFAADHPSHLRVMFGRGLPETFEAPAHLHAEGTRAYSALIDSVAALVPPNVRGCASIEEIAFDAWSLVHGIAMLWIDGQVRQIVHDRQALLAITERAVRRSIAGLVKGAR